MVKGIWNFFSLACENVYDDVVYRTRTLLINPLGLEIIHFSSFCMKQLFYFKGRRSWGCAGSRFATTIFCWLCKLFRVKSSQVETFSCKPGIKNVSFQQTSRPPSILGRLVLFIRRFYIIQVSERRQQLKRGKSSVVFHVNLPPTKTD